MGETCATVEVEIGQDAELGLLSWGGRHWQRVYVVGETPKRFRIQAINRTKLAGRCRWIDRGETTLVPKHALRPVYTPETGPGDQPAKSE